MTASYLLVLAVIFSISSASIYAIFSSSFHHIQQMYPAEFLETHTQPAVLMPIIASLDTSLKFQCLGLDQNSLFTRARAKWTAFTNLTGTRPQYGRNSFKPSGWYSIVEGINDKYKRSRCHVIAKGLGGSGTNKCNLFTCYKEFNNEVMNHFEIEFTKYVKGLRSSAGQTCQLDVRLFYKPDNRSPYLMNPPDVVDRAQMVAICRNTKLFDVVLYNRMAKHLVVVHNCKPRFKVATRKIIQASLVQVPVESC